MDAVIRQASAIRGTLALPADKAICHRAALLCAIAKGATEIHPWSTAQDCQRTLDVLRGLGVSVTQTPSGIRIEGVGLHGLREPTGVLDCGDSGTTMRLSCGLLAGQPFTSVLAAGPSLSRRPMRRIVEPLSSMGARFKGAEGGEVYPPLEVTGKRPLQAIRYPMPMASAQVKSAILLAGLYAEGPTEVIEPVETRDHTERMLNHFGVLVRAGGNVILEGPAMNLSSPGRLRIPADPSSAAFFIVAATLVPDSRLALRDVGLNPSRVQFLEVLKRMGAAVQQKVEDDGWEPRGTITVESARLRGTTVLAGEVPLVIDELPILMVAACFAGGETRFEGLHELKVKETDRLHSMTAGLRAMDAQLVAHEAADLVIRGGRSLRGALVDSFGDHRTAMSLAVAGLMAEGTTTIQQADCVAKSLGSFFELLASVAGSSSVQMG